jgi:hypothetical protein
MTIITAFTLNSVITLKRLVEAHNSSLSGIVALGIAKINGNSQTVASYNAARAASSKNDAISAMLMASFAFNDVQSASVTFLCFFIKTILALAASAVRIWGYVPSGCLLRWLRV